MAFLQAYDALQTMGGDPQTIAGRQAALLNEWMTARLRELLKELRENRPIFRSPNSVLVTKNQDVREVLARDDVFTVTYAPIIGQLLDGPFILGMPNSPQYERELSILRLAFSRHDVARVRDFAARTAEELVQRALPHGRIDVVGGLSRVVPARLVAQIFGVPGPDEATLMRWMRSQFWEIFVNLSRDPGVIAAAHKDAVEIRSHLNQLIAERKGRLAASPPPTNGGANSIDMLTRLIQMQREPATAMSDDDVRRNISGVIIGAVDTTSKSVAHAIDFLMHRPDQLAAAQQAARDDNDDLVKAYIFEAMRFKPQADFLYRACLRDCVLGRGTNRAAEISAGSFVLASTTSAMFDPDVVVDPDEFRIDRDPREYLFFGHQLHTCFGQFINAVQIPQICKPLLRLPGLRPAEGEAGKIRYEGPFPDAFWLAFDNHR